MYDLREHRPQLTSSQVLTVATVCLTLQSMLASCKKKERPVDNDRYVQSAPDNPKKACSIQYSQLD